SHHIRVAALTALCSVIEKLLSSNDLDDGQIKMRDNLLKILREHVHDETGFIRQHCLQLWTSLVIEKKVPVTQYLEVFELGLARLIDIDCVVRKDAVTLVMHMILNNPYFDFDSTRAELEKAQNDAETKLAKLRQEFEKLHKIMEEKKPQSDDEDSGAEDKNIDDNNEMNVDNNQKKEIEENKESYEDQSFQVMSNCFEIQEQAIQQEEIIAFYKDSLRFMDLIEQANRHVVNLFNSSTVADCKEAIHFFVNLHHYRLILPNIEQNLRSMFILIRSVDKSICEAITQAFVKIYFDVGPTVPLAYVFLF
ncbi:unnamed protein product, partial [Rotaria sordida]